jgi:DNA polymerase IV (DinB-like DNA polymerase)
MKIKGKVFETEQITCSIGASNSKIVSKIATDFNKPDGLTIIEPERVVEFLSPLSVGKIPGIGKKTQKVLEEKFGIKTISDLSRADLQALRDRFGRSALWMKLVAEGREYSSVTEGWEPVSISSETTFETDELEFQKIVDTLREIAIDVVNRANEDGYFFSNVGIKIRFTGFDTHTRSKELPTSTNSLQTVVVECEKMLAEFRGSKKGVRLIGVKLSSLKHMDKGEQSTLLDFGASNI